MKILILFLISFNCFSWSFSDLEKLRSLELMGKWRIYLNVEFDSDGEIPNHLYQYKMPQINYYQEKSFKGKPYAVLSEEGYTVNDEVVCIAKISNEPHGIREKKDRKIYMLEPIPRSGTTYNICYDAPFRNLGAQKFYHSTIYFDEIKDDIGYLKINDVQTYVDLKPFKGKYVLPPAKHEIRRVFGEQELKEIEALMNKYHEIVKSKDRNKLKTFFIDQLTIGYKIIPNTKGYFRKLLNHDKDYYLSTLYKKYLFCSDLSRIGLKKSRSALRKIGESGIISLSERCSPQILLYKNPKKGWWIKFNGF